MELQQLRYFCAVVESGSINAASRRLDMTQPPVSMQMRLLEKELGCTLFRRGSRRIELTEEGRVLYRHAVRLINMAGAAAAAVEDCHSAVSGTLRIGVVSSLAHLSAGRWFAPFAKAHPQVNFELSEGSTYVLLGKLSNREIDIALIRQPFSARGFEYVSLRPQALLAVASGDRLPGNEEGISLEALSKHELIVYRRWSAVIDQAFAARGLSPRIVCTADDVRTCISWAESDLGTAVAPEDVGQYLSESGLAFKTITGLPPTAQTTLATNEGGCDTAVAKAFKAFFCKLNERYIS